MSNEPRLFVQHTGTVSGSLLLADIEDGGERGSRSPKSGPVYVPENGSVSLLFTDSVKQSFISGTIKQFEELGYITSYLDGRSKNYQVQGPTELWVSSNGSDSNIGSEAEPLRTVKEAVSRLSLLNDYVTWRTINILQDEDGAWDPGFTDVNWVLMNYIRFQGEVTNSDAFTVDSVDSVSESDGDLVTLTTSSTYALDDLQGTLFQVTGGTANGKYGRIVANAATVAGSTQVRAVVGDGGYFALTGATSLQTFTRPQLDMGSNHFTIDECGFIQFQDIVFEYASNRGMDTAVSQRIDLVRCDVTGGNHINSGSNGRLRLEKCWVDVSGQGFARWGGVRIVGELQTVDNFWDFSRGANDRSHFLVMPTGEWNQGGYEYCRGVGDLGILVEGGQVKLISGTIDIGRTATIVFGLDSAGTATCIGGIVGNDIQGARGTVETRLLGEITAARTVVIQNGMYVLLRTGTSVTDATGTNTFSADGGGTTAATEASTNTFIVGP